MSYARAIEGEDSAQVLDRGFHRGINNPSVAQVFKAAGIPAPPVASIRQPRIVSYPRPASATAASDLKGQEGLQVALDRLSANRAKIIARERGVAAKKEKQILKTAVEAVQRAQARIRPGAAVSPPASRAVTVWPRAQRILTAGMQAFGRKRARSGLSGLGQQPALTVAPEPIQMVTPIEPSVVAAKITSGETLTANEQALWSGLTPAARGVFAQLPIAVFVSQAAKQAVAAPATALGPAGAVRTSTAGQIQSWLSQQSIQGIPNGLLAAGVLGGAVVIGTAKKKRR